MSAKSLDTRPPSLFHSWEPLFSRPWRMAICEGDRDAGKSFPLLIRALHRARRHHRSMIWIRRTGEEAESLIKSFGSDKWLKVLDLCAMPEWRVRIKGSAVQYNEATKEAPSWVPLIRYGALSQWASFRDTDDPRDELIYLDEALSTPERIRMYRGNEVEHGLDIFKSMWRGDSDVRFLMAGNIEMVCNPWLDYFGLARPEISEGFRRLMLDRKAPAGVNSIMYERVVNRNPNGFGSLVKGTAYGAFIDGSAKGTNPRLIAPLSKSSRLYASVDIGGYLSIWRSGDYLTFSTRRVSSPVLKLAPDGDRNTVVLTSKVKARLTLLRRMWQRGLIRFDGDLSAELARHALKYLV